MATQICSAFWIKFSYVWATGLYYTGPWCTCISKKKFRSGGMAASGCTHFVRAVTVTPVADYFAPGTNTKRRVTYLPPIAVLPFLLTLSVFNCKQTLWYCGQLWPYVRMDWLGTSTKCKSVRKPHTNLPDTPVAFTSASKYCQMLPGPPGALQSALRLCKSILRCSWKHLQVWRYIQDATRFDN